MFKSYQESVENAIKMLDELKEQQLKLIVNAENTLQATFICNNPSPRYNLQQTLTYIGTLRKTLDEIERYRTQLSKELKEMTKPTKRPAKK